MRREQKAGSKGGCNKVLILPSWKNLADVSRMTRPQKGKYHLYVKSKKIIQLNFTKQKHTHIYRRQIYGFSLWKSG